MVANSSGDSGCDTAMMRLGKRDKAWLAMLDGQDGRIECQMEENILTASNRNKVRHVQQCHIGQASYEKNCSSSPGKAGQAQCLN